MNKKLEAVLVGLVVFTSAYLAGCFVEADFNISHWNQVTRLFVGVIGMLISVMITPLYYNEIKHY